MSLKEHMPSYVSLCSAVRDADLLITIQIVKQSIKSLALHNKNNHFTYFSPVQHYTILLF